MTSAYHLVPTIIYPSISVLSSPLLLTIECRYGRLFAFVPVLGFLNHFETRRSQLLGAISARSALAPQPQLWADPEP